MANKTTLRRKNSVRRAIRKKGGGRIRLSVFRSSKHMHAQVIDDKTGTTLASASTLDASYKGKGTSNKDAATAIGKMVAERAVKAGVKEVVFDRGSYAYHGRVKALADAAREAGLSF